MKLRLDERMLAAAIMVSTLVHIVLAARLPITDDEAYYLLWSRRLAWSYPDHPPMIAALVAISARLFGTSPFGLRVVPILCAAAMAVIVYLAARSLFDRATAQRSTLIVLVMPAMFIGAAFAFPDVPMSLFWVLCLWTGWRALTTGGWWWLAVGAATGLALLSKLTGFAFVLGLVGAWAGGDWRRALRDPWLYPGALVALALFAPVVLWNVRHDWALVAVTLNRDPWLLEGSLPGNLALFVVGQVGYYGFLVPLLVGAGIVALRRSREPVWRYLAWMTLPLLTVMFAAAFDGRTKPHWPGQAYLSAAMALGALWPDWARARPRVLWVTAGLTVVLSAALVAATLFAWGQLAPQAGFVRWDSVAAAIDQQLARQPDQTLVLTDTYQAASLLSYYLRTRVPIASFQGAFAFWQDREAWSGRTALYVDEIGSRHKAPAASMCQRMRALDEMPLSPWRTVRLHRCEDVRFP